MTEKYRKLIAEMVEQKEHYRKTFVTGKQTLENTMQLNGYDIHINLYTTFVQELEYMERQINSLESENAVLKQTIKLTNTAVGTLIRKLIREYETCINVTGWAYTTLAQLKSFIKKNKTND